VEKLAWLVLFSAREGTMQSGRDRVLLCWRKVQCRELGSQGKRHQVQVQVARPFTRPRTWRGGRRWKAVWWSCHITVINVSEADLTVRAETFSQRHFLKTAQYNSEHIKIIRSNNQQWKKNHPSQQKKSY